jgi:hypothetical protein
MSLLNSTFSDCEYGSSQGREVSLIRFVSVFNIGFIIKWLPTILKSGDKRLLLETNGWAVISQREAYICFYLWCSLPTSEEAPGV